MKFSCSDPISTALFAAGLSPKEVAHLPIITARNRGRHLERSGGQPRGKFKACCREMRSEDRIQNMAIDASKWHGMGSEVRREVKSEASEVEFRSASCFVGRSESVASSSNDWVQPHWEIPDLTSWR